jgi:aminopeptidase
LKDPRITLLAHNLIVNSCRLKKGEHVLIENFGLERELVNALVEQAYAAGGIAHVLLQDNAVRRAVLLGATEQQLALDAEIDGARMARMQAYIGLRSGDNASELSDVPPEKLELYNKIYSEPVHGQIRVPRTKWVVLRYPSASMAQQAGMSTEAFEDYYFNVCCLDYSKMARAMEPLIALMNRTDRVVLKGPGKTDLSFSIRGIPAIGCAGEMNIPDGEVFTAPVRESVNGVIAFNTPSVHDGFTFENIVLTFKDGKIVDAQANDTARINRVLDTDEGARFVGEFALGVNPCITSPMKDTLFDEKIAGSIHFTPGSCYDEAPNGNHSAIHWDLVMIQRPDYGGGEIWFDDVLVRRDGLFVPEALWALNPQHLI